MNDFKLLQSILANYKKLIECGNSNYASAYVAIKNHNSRYNLDDTNAPLVIYQGDYVLILGNTKQIYKQIYGNN
jgi:hypothetical protein